MSEEELRKIALRHQAIMPLTRQEHAAAIIAAMSEAVATETIRCTAEWLAKFHALGRQEPAPDEGAG